jgi:hypothetical protein
MSRVVRAQHERMEAAAVQVQAPQPEPGIAMAAG